MFDCIPFPSFTHTTGMTHFLDVRLVRKNHGGNPHMLPWRFPVSWPPTTTPRGIRLADGVKGSRPEYKVSCSCRKVAKAANKFGGLVNMNLSIQAEPRAMNFSLYSFLCKMLNG